MNKFMTNKIINIPFLYIKVENNYRQNINSLLLYTVIIMN